MFWKPNINQGPIVEGTLEKKKLHFIGLRIYIYLEPLPMQNYRSILELKLL